MITGADYWKKKRGCINLHAGSNYSRIALHNVTILQGVALNSFREDNAMCCGKMDFRRIFFFSKFQLYFYPSLEMQLFFVFLFFFFGLDFERKFFYLFILVFVEHRLFKTKDRLSDDIYSRNRIVINFHFFHSKIVIRLFQFWRVFHAWSILSRRKICFFPYRTIGTKGAAIFSREPRWIAIHRYSRASHLEFGGKFERKFD